MNISGVNRAGDRYGSYPAKNKTAASGSFMDAVEEARRENEKASSASDEIIEFSEGGTGKITLYGSYEVTEKQAEYFREKYGTGYDSEKSVELYYQLADNGVISESDACTLTGVGGVIFLGDIDLSLDEVRRNGFGHFSVQPEKFERHLVKSIVYTDPDSPLYGLWQRFESEYGRISKTWADDIEKRIAFERWQYENGRFTADYDISAYEKRVEGLEKTLSVINRIFG